MKKTLIFIALVSLLFITACGSDNSSAKDESVTLKLGLWNQDQAKVYKEVLARFEEENPNINVEIQTTPVDKYWTKLQTAASSNEIPDVFWINGPNFIKYASNDILLPLNDYISESDMDWGKFPDSLKELYTYEDDKYAIPKDIDTIGLYYNKELFDEAGVDYPDDSWDWEQFLEAAKKLTDKEKGIYGFAAQLYPQAGHYNTIYQAGGYVVSDDLKKSGFDDPKTIKGLKFFTDMIHVHKVSPTLAQMTDTEARQLFESNKVAMHFDGSWMAKVFQESFGDKVDVSELPKDEKRATIIHGLGHAISSKTENPDAAWKLVEYLASNEVNSTFSESGLFLPANQDVWDTWVESVPDMNTQVFTDMIDYSVPYPVTKNTAEWELLQEEYLTKAWDGTEDIEDMAKKLAKEMNEVLNK
jgi:multiple sugar transport system substrate-binding protein